MVFNYHDDRTNILISFVLCSSSSESQGARVEGSHLHRYASKGNPVERGLDRVRVVLRAKEKQYSCAHR